MITCKWKNCQNEVLPPKRKYCSDKCKNIDSTTNSKKRLKLRLVDHFGGECIRCGYRKCPGALQFHHPNDDKDFGLATKQTAAWNILVKEASKCELICANCHAEEHWL